MSSRHYIARALHDIDSVAARRLAPVDEARVITALARGRAVEASTTHPAKCKCTACRIRRHDDQVRDARTPATTPEETSQ